MNVFDYLFETSKNLDKDFLLGSKETASFKKLYNDSLSLASYLRNSVGEGQNVLLISSNSAFFITAYLGILKSGNTCVPIDFSIEQSNLDYIIDTIESQTIFVDKLAQRKLEFNSEINLIDENKKSQLINNKINKTITSTISLNTIAEIIFTSGSTGKPKGVMISHHNIISNTNSIIEYLKLSSKDIMAVVLPFYYCYGLSLLHTHLKVGGSIVINNNFMFLGTVINDLKNYNCTGFAGVPSHFQILLKKSQSFKTEAFPSLRYATQAGGKLHSVFIDEFTTTLPTKELFIMYGQTEATARLTYLPPEFIKTKISSIGKAIPNVELKIINKNGEITKINEEGELLARGENIMLGYYKDETATNLAIKNGWLHTGDLARIDDDGFIYIVARKKEIIKAGGKRISPKEIEEVILSIPEVIDCTISGYEDDLLGEAIQAIITLNTSINENEIKESILKKCAKNLAFYKIPQRIIFEKTIQMSATGKKKIN